MKFSSEEIEAINGRRNAAKYIKDGIDIEHINSTDDLVRTFRIAFGRAEREKLLEQALACD